ncbi:Copia protein [Termitomyces sp. J132]|nr:Copia protein [Termitomyces sp. J132]
MAVFEAKQECVWLWTLLQEIGYDLQDTTMIICNNNVAINLSEDPMLHSCVKHVAIKYHFLFECVALKEIAIQYINTRDNIANLFTNPLPLPQFS